VQWRLSLGVTLLLFIVGRGIGIRAERLAPVSTLSTDLRHVRAVTADGLATFATDFRHVLPIFAHGSSALAADACHVRSITADRFATFATNARHMQPIPADGLAALTSRFSGLLRRKLVSATFDVGCFTPLARDLSLPLLRHRGETAPRTFRHDAS
jgi:hypothetical protein